ncbi:hypothetical protein DFH29DRAFT_591619 [Suillus ampliporus]|nr:hypothetical protein DFH29DRAFT_591619 [Suillus ampliporus]
MSPLTKAWSLMVVLAAAAIVPRDAFAQTSTVTCQPGFDWMNNTLNQNPCTVAVYLASVCSGGDFGVNPIPVGTFYAAPTGPQANACECSTVTYSLISACGDCQNRTFLRRVGTVGSTLVLRRFKCEREDDDWMQFPSHDLMTDYDYISMQCSC